MAQEPGQKPIDSRNTEGVIFVTRRGTGFITDPRFPEDIEIKSNDLGTALNGDTVTAEILGKEDGRVQGRITSVIKRTRTRFVGTLEKDGDTFFLKPDDSKVHVDIILKKNDVAAVDEGTKLYVEMHDWKDPRKNPTGHVLEIIGKRGAHAVEMQSIILEHGFETAFPRRIEEEAESIKGEAAITAKDASRRDVRGTPTFTIDPHDAKDFDDALSVRKLENGDIEVGVHIADVTHYVRPGSLIDEVARERATSVYLVDRTIPMLPEALSNDVCSLNPGEDKRTFSAIFVMNGNAEVKDRWFGETVIHSNKRFTYEEAQGVLDRGNGLLFDELSVVRTLAQKLRAKRGAVDFDQDEIGFELDKTGKPIRIYKKARQDTNKMIEDFMLLANREVATYMYEHTKQTAGKNAAFVYRVHDVPDPEKIEELGIFIRAIGYEFDTKHGVVSAQDINKLFKEIEGKPEENLIKTATIRSMAKAVYSTKNIGHFGLSFKYYTHFTSPIRRYPDMMVHRMLRHHLNKTPVSDKEISEYNYLAIKSSEREVEAVRAERDSIKYKQVEYMQGKIGEQFEAVVSGVTEYGIFVEDTATKAEGLVRIGTIDGDYYLFEPKKYRLVGEKNKKTFALGDKVNVKLTRADLDSRTLDFELV